MADAKIDVSIEHKQAAEPAARRSTRTPARAAARTTATTSSTASLRVCPQCGHHFPVRARERIEQLADPGSFVEEAADLRSADPLDFFDLRPYTERLAEAELATGLGDAIVIGRATIERHRRASSRSWTSRSWAARWAASSARSSRAPAKRGRATGVPLVSVTASGGARMQEGILSLMQLPKTVCAVEELHEAGLRADLA